MSRYSAHYNIFTKKPKVYEQSVFDIKKAYRTVCINSIAQTINPTDLKLAILN